MKNKYVLITAAYNEELFIVKTIESVLEQSILPEKWIIISDASSDETDNIVIEYSKKHAFIEFYRREDKAKNEHNFSSKVLALNCAIDKIDLSSFRYLGVLDADIVLPNNYYEVLLNKFYENDKLGLIGGIVYERINGKNVRHDISLNTVTGSIQFYRMDCFMQFQNFIGMPYGGEDSIMCIKACYNNWIVRTYTDLVVFEQKYIGRANESFLKMRIQRGKRFYDLGYHPLFMLIRCIYRIKDKPILIGSILEISSYSLLALRKTDRNSPTELIKFLRKEQMRKIFLFRRNN